MREAARLKYFTEEEEDTVKEAEACQKIVDFYSEKLRCLLHFVVSSRLSKVRL